MKQEAMVVLTPYETTLLGKKTNSKAVALTEDKRTCAILNNMLSQKSVVALSDGTSVEATFEEILVARAIAFEYMNPRGLDTLEKLAKIRGEVDDNKAIDVNVSLVDSDLAKRAIE